MSTTKAASPTPDTDPLALEVDGLRYALDRPPSKAGKKVIASVALAGGGDVPLVDRVDLYAFRSRRAFATLVSDTFGRGVDAVLGHLALLLDQVERALPEQGRPAPVTLTIARTKAAAELLAAPDLLDRAAAAVEELGYVGEACRARCPRSCARPRAPGSPSCSIGRPRSCPRSRSSSCRA